MNIGDRIKELRTKSDKTLEEVGSYIGASKQTMYKYENNAVSNIPSDKIEKLAELFNVTPAYLMGWADKEPIESVDELIEDFPEGIRMIRRASKELSPKDRERLIKIMKSYLDQEDGE